MSTKEWLMRAWKIDNEIAALERELTLARERAMSITGHASDVKVQTSSKNTTEDAIHKCIEYEQKIRSRQLYLIDLKDEIATAIGNVDDPTYRTLLILRYLQYLPWEEIAPMMAYSVRNIHILHKKALKKVVISQ